MSQHLDSLVPGRDSLQVRGPVGEIEYVAPGAFDVAGRRLVAARLNMIAGGTGITPMYQVAKVARAWRCCPRVCVCLCAPQSPATLHPHSSCVRVRVRVRARGWQGRAQHRLWHTRPGEGHAAMLDTGCMRGPRARVRSAAAALHTHTHTHTRPPAPPGHPRGPEGPHGAAPALRQQDATRRAAGRRAPGGAGRTAL
jgi:NAD(P)H-flavin reductase